MMIKREIFQNCRKLESGVFQSQQQIKKPTLLINAELETHNKFLRFLRLKSVLPITDFVKLRLYFKNIFSSEIPGTNDVPFIIEYPNGKQVRPWKINLPNLKNENECCYSESEILFKPEVPGVHRLIIGKSEGFQYADLFGVTDREIKQIANDWTTSFNIIDSLEMRFYVAATLALVISAFSLILAAL